MPIISAFVEARKMTQNPIPMEQRVIILESQSAKIGLNEAEIRARYLSIDVEVKVRSDSVGTANFERYIPRIWSGYCYLINNNSIISVRAIEYKNNRIYQKEFQSIPWLLNRGYGVVGATYDQLGNVVDREPLQHRDAWWSYAEMLFNNVSSAGSYLTHLIDSVAVYVPVGVDVAVKINHIPYEEIFGISRNEDGNWVGGFRSLNDLIFIPYESANEDVTEEVESPQTLDDYVSAKGYIKPSQLPQACQNIGYVNGAESLKQIWRDSGFLPLQIRQKLLEQGAISQSQIDEILSENPSYSDEQILDRLIEKGYISAQELSKATNALSISETFPLRGKKAAWIYAIRSITPGCADSLGRWTLIAYWYDAVGQVVNAVVWNSQLNFPTPSQLPWGSIGNGNYNMITSATFIPNYGNLCGQSVGLGSIFVDGVKVRERGDLLESPRWFWVRQP